MSFARFHRGQAVVARTLATVSWPRIAATSTTLTAHVLAGLVLTLASAPTTPLPASNEVVTVVEFIPESGRDRLIVAPPPPPAPPQATSNSARQAAPAEATPPPVEQGTELASDAATATVEATPSNADLPAPDFPPTEILSYRQAHQPHYPREAREAGESGWVTLRVLVDVDGSPLTATIVRSTATERLAQSAMDAVMKWRFNPAMKDGSAITAWIEVPIGFFNSRRAG